MYTFYSQFSTRTDRKCVAKRAGCSKNPLFFALRNSFIQWGINETITKLSWKFEENRTSGRFYFFKQKKEHEKWNPLYKSLPRVFIFAPGLSYDHFSVDHAWLLPAFQLVRRYDEVKWHNVWTLGSKHHVLAMNEHYVHVCEGSCVCSNTHAVPDLGLVPGKREWTFRIL